MLAEQQTEWIINNNLVNKGWNIDGNSNEKNVFFQNPKLEKQRKKLRGKRPDYILYKTGTDKPIGVIEAKKAGKNLDPALKQATEYAQALDAPLVFAMNGAYCETRFVPNNKELILNGVEVKELIREREALKFLTENTNEIYTLPKKVIISRNELINIFRDLNSTLRGEGLRAGIERFSEFANLLFLKLLNENEKDNYWDDIKKLPDNIFIETINNSIIKKIETKYGGGVFTPISIKNPRTLRKIIERVDPLILSTIDTDIKGDAFEYFLEKTTSTNNDLGEYFTPRHVIKTIVDLASPRFKETIYDPFCGTGGFLTEGFNYIKENNIIKCEEDLKRLKQNTLYGGEITTTARIAKMNMVLHGDGHSGVKQINSLANPINGKYDIVLTNIPFSQTTEFSSLYYNGISRKNGDSACILHCLRALKEGGRMALVVPEAFLIRKDIARVRKFLLSKIKLQSVISLPHGVFLPYSGVKTAILYFTNAHKANKQKNYWYFDVKNDGYSLDSRRRPLRGKNDLHKVSESDFKKVEKDDSLKDDILEIGFRIIDLEKVKKNSHYKLVGGIYKEVIRNGRYDFCRVKDIVKFVRGFSYKSIFISDQGIPMYNLKSIKKDFVLDYSFKFIKSDVVIQEKHMCKDGDLLMAITDLTPTSEIIGRTVIAKERGIFSMDLAKLEIDTSNVFNKYLHYVFNSREFLNEAKMFSVGNNVKHLDLDCVLLIQIPLPPIEEQRKIIEQIDSYQNMIESQKDAIKFSENKIKNRLNDLWKS